MTSSKNKIFHIGSILSIYKPDVELFFKIIEASCELGFRFSVLAEGDQALQKTLFDYSDRYPKNLFVFENIPQNKEKILKQSNAILFLTTPEKTLITEAIKEDTVPIIAEDKIFKNFNSSSETGNAFTFQKKDIWSLLSAIIRASENYKFSYDWKNLQKKLRNLIIQNSLADL